MFLCTVRGKVHSSLLRGCCFERLSGCRCSVMRSKDEIGISFRCCEVLCGDGLGHTFLLYNFGKILRVMLKGQDRNLSPMT